MEQTTAINAPQEERLSKRNLWGYSMGGIGRDMVYQLVNTALMTFMLISKDLTAAQVTAITVIFIVCRIFDGCNDPFMGAVIERTRTKFGKFKPWMMIGMITNIVVICLLFFVDLKGWDWVIFFGFMYLLWGITYTMNDISYWGMMPSLASHPDDRNNITTLANIGAGVGAGLAIGATSLFGYGDLANKLFGGAINAYHIIAAVICIIFAACQTMTFFVVKEKPLPPLQPRVKGEEGPLKKIFKTIFHNDQLLVTAGSMLMYNVGAAVLNLFSTYWVWLRYGYQGTLVTVFSLLTACSAVIIIVYPWMSKRMSRRKIATISFSTIIIGYSLLLILGLVTGFTLERGSKADSIVFYFIAICGAIAFFGQTLFYQVLTISIANTVEYNDYKTGERNEGAIFSVRPFMAKMGSAIGVGIQGLGLVVLGISTVTNQISAVENDKYAERITEEVQMSKIAEILGNANSDMSQWLIVFMSVIPMLFIIGAFVLYMLKYNISEEKYEEICAAIAERDAAKAVENENELESGEITEVLAEDNSTFSVYANEDEIVESADEIETPDESGQDNE